MADSRLLDRDVSRRLKTGLRPGAVLWLVLLIAPPVIGLVWGIYFDDGAYVAFRYARDLAAGRGLSQGAVEGAQILLKAPLYVLALSLAARLGIPLPQAGLILSALGWGAAAIAIHSAGRTMRRSAAPVMSALLVVFSPITVSTLGTEVSWAVALAWIAVVSSMRKRWNVQTGALALMLGAHFDLSTLALAWLLLVIRWVEGRRFPLWPGLILTVVALGWALIAVVCHVPIIPRWSPDVGYWVLVVRRLLRESEFYWLFLPLSLCGVIGLFPTRRKVVWAGWFLWGGVAILNGGAVATAMMATLCLFLAGSGIDRVVEWVEVHDALRLDHLALTVSLALIAGLPLGMAQASSLVQRYRFRPVVRLALERRAGDWLRAHTEPAATVFASERVGYLADRPSLSWDGGASDQATLANLLRALNENPPDYCVSFRSIGWSHLTRAGWFRDNYTPMQQFESPYDATSPFTVWGYRFRGVDWGERRPLNVQLPEGVDWVGYSYSPDRVRPGDGVHVAYFLQATRPVTEPFHVIVEVISPSDGVGWARQTITPSSVLMGWWQAGGVIAERVVLTTTTDIPVGAHHLDVHVVTPDSRSFLPIYRNGDTAPLDRITLGYVVVPWQGRPDIEEPVDADFGRQITLVGFEVEDGLSPGGEFDVTLYWEAQRPPDDDYIVFVHLLGADGQVVAGHDGPPMGGRYATRAWIPGEVVPDVHRLVLGPAVPVGTYRLQVGMYRWPSMERLPVWDKDGVEQADRAVLLGSIEVRR